MTTQVEIRERVLSRVTTEDRGWITPCWVSNRSASDAYGHTGMRVDRRLRPTHCWAYEAWVGPIPDGTELDHLCRVPACCRPSHLDPVTHRENLLRGVGASAQNARKTHCPRSHPLDGDNLYVSNGKRRCRICTLEQNARSAARSR